MPHSIDLHKGLSQLGNDVIFWYLHASRKHYPWKDLTHGKNFFIFKKTIFDFLKLYRQAKKQDIVIITGWHSWGHVLLAALLKYSNCKCSFWLDVPSPPVPGFKKQLKSIILSFADGYFITGKAGYDAFQAYYRLDMKKCYDFPYLEKKPVLAKIQKINKAREKALSGGEPIRLLISNRFIQRKGYSIVYEAIRKLSKDMLNRLKIDILGVGVEKEYYKAKLTAVSKNIKLHGWVEYNQYLDFMNYTDIYLHASIHEPYGIPPMDAMSRGKLVISSDGVISCRSRIKHGQNGYLYDAMSPDQLKELIEKTVQYPKKIYQIGERGLKESKKYGVLYNYKSIVEFLK